VRAFWLAWQFLTRFPVPAVGFDGPTAGRSLLCYPLVGLLLGGLLSGLAASLTGTPAYLLAGILLTAWVLATGALHLDGLADCADAWVGGHGDRERSLRIMKDPAAGPVAVCLLVLILLLKWAALTALLERHDPTPLWTAPLLGRTAILLLMLTADYVSPAGLAATWLAHADFRAMRWTVGAALLVALGLSGWLPLLAAGLVLWWLRRAALARLGGVTGDVYGAAVELVETAVLLAVAL